MKLITLFLSILTIFPPLAYSFTNPLAHSFKDPTHEECRQWARNAIFAGAALHGLALLAYIVACTSDSFPTLVGITLPTTGIHACGVALYVAAYCEYFLHKNPQRASEWHALQQKRGINQSRKNNVAICALFSHTQFKIGAAAIGLGFLTSFTHRDTSDPAFILTFAGTILVAEKIYSELKKA